MLNKNWILFTPNFIVISFIIETPENTRKLVSFKIREIASNPTKFNLGSKQ